MATPVVRADLSLHRFRLDCRYFRRIAVPSVKAITVAAQSESGAWANTTIEVRKIGGSASYAFSSAKTIAPGGGAIAISSSELEGIGEIEILAKPNGGGSYDSAGAFATVTVTFEQEVSEPAQVPGGRVNFDTGPISMPIDGSNIDF